jgi:DNA polymerase III delta subunit
MNSWALKNASQELGKWRPEQLAMAIEAVAAADYAVKGGVVKGSRGAINSDYALESAVLAIASRRSVGA